MSFTEEMIVKAAKEAYQQTNADFEIIPGNCALLVIDMQEEYVRPGWKKSWIPDATRQIPKIKQLIGFCREKDIPVIYTASSYKHIFYDRPEMAYYFMPKDFTDPKQAGKWFKEPVIWHEIAPRDEELIIYKPSYGAFYDTPLETILHNLKKDTIIICGTLTNYCCGTTARQGYERGFKVIFGSDITSTDDPEMQEPELKVLRKGFARVMNAAQIIERLS